MALQIAALDTGTQTVISLTGESDLSTVAQLDEAIHAALPPHALPVRVVIDLAGLTFLDCVTIGVLVAGRARAATLGIDVRVLNPRGLVAMVLRLTGTLDYLTGPEPPTPGNG